MNNKDLFKILRDTISRIKNELLLFSVVIIILLTFVRYELRFFILLVYIIGSLLYVLIIFIRSYYKKPSKRYIDNFKNLLDRFAWKKEFIDYKETWLCEEDNSYQIEISRERINFKESFTNVFPDKDGSCRIPVYLKVNGNRIKEMQFIMCDGGRIFIPLPEIKMENNKRIWFLKKTSLRYKLGNIIGDFYIYENIDKIAERSGIRILN